MSQPIPVRSRMLAAAVALAALVALLSVPAGPATAAAGDPIREQGVVTRVVDGDTLMFREVGSTSETSIRLAGIQAFETGACGADIATERLRQLVEGRSVTLRARVSSSSSLGRPIRSVHLPLKSGGSADINQLMLLEGMGLWFPLGQEITDTASYHVAATHARRHGRGIWGDDLCGAGPAADHPLDMWVKSDADSDDSKNRNDEYVVVVNRDRSRSIDLSGWILTDSSHAEHRIRSGTSLAPGARIRFRVGNGTDSATSQYMGFAEPIFDNADRASGIGDGAYLLDTRGNVRKAFTYPCVVDCKTPLAGKLKIDHVEYDPSGVDTADTEFVRLKNVSSGRIELDGYQLRNVTISHEFRANTYLDAGETLTVFLGSGTSTRTTQYWGIGGPFLANSGDNVDVLSWDERYVDCRDWGSGRPCPWPVTVPGAGTSGALPTDPELASDVTDGWTFSDVDPDSTHGAAIDWLVEAGITTGCGDGKYCPTKAVTRAQMATFLTKALDLPPAPPQGFVDVARDATHAAAIDSLAASGITSGCGDRTFCPAKDVTREQMATFLARALDLPAAPPQGFVDVAPDARHAAAIDSLAASGITSGCGDGKFCPTRAVTRAQMATFLRAALG